MPQMIVLPRPSQRLSPAGPVAHIPASETHSRDASQALGPFVHACETNVTSGLMSSAEAVSRDDEMAASWKHTGLRVFVAPAKTFGGA